MDRCSSSGESSQVREESEEKEAEEKESIEIRAREKVEKSQNFFGSKNT